MEKIWMSIDSLTQTIIICVLLVLLSCSCAAMVYRLVRFGVKFKAKVGAAEIDIDASEENEPIKSKK